MNKLICIQFVEQGSVFAILGVNNDQCCAIVLNKWFQSQEKLLDLGVYIVYTFQSSALGAPVEWYVLL